MGILNRQRRIKKKRIAEKKKKKSLNQINNIHIKKEKNTIKFTAIQNPLANLSIKQKQLLLQKIKEEAQKDYQESLEKIQQMILEYDAPLLMSMLSNYYLTSNIGQNGVEIKEKNINQSHIEIIQALFLRINPALLKHRIFTPNITQELIDALPLLTTAIYNKNMSPEDLELSQERLVQKRIQSWVQAHTQTVRNWGFIFQVKNISQEIYSNFDSKLEDTYGFSCSNLIHFFDYLLKAIEKSMNERLTFLRDLHKTKDVQDILEKYHRAMQLEDNVEDIIAMYKSLQIPRQQILYDLLVHHDLILIDYYTFSVHEISASINLPLEIIEAIINHLSYSEGALVDYPIEHIFLANPIWLKPIVKLPHNKIFCPLPQLFFSFILKIFDHLINQIDSIKLSQIKANYLENKIQEIVHRKFPEQLTVSSIKWKIGNIEYETDLIAFIGSYAVIIEAKSHTISDEALRGAPGRLKKKIHEILVEPNLQSNRFKQKLEYLIKNPHIDAPLRKKLPIDLSSIHKILRVSITLEYFAALQTNVYELKDTGWIPKDYSPCPTMNLADFETLFDIFEHPIQILNYLEQRSEIEGTLLYKGDELDLMGLYMENHFNFSNIDTQGILMISGASKKIDAYYESLAEGITILKPVPIMNQFFENILLQLENRKPSRWLEIGSIIYRLLPQDQVRIVTELKKLKTNVRKNWHITGHKNLLIYTPPLSSEYAFCFIIFNEQNKEDRYRFCEEAASMSLESSHVKYCVAIGLNIDREDIAYALIGVYQ